MENFTFQNPTKLIFGKGMIAQLAKEIPAEAKVMVTFGGGSVKSNGVYDQVKSALSAIPHIEFWGIESNPQIETLRKAIEIGKKEEVNFLLAVGGGSVIDGTKLIAGGLLIEEDAWTLVNTYVANSVPLATVLTLPATGSEMNGNGVISNGETKEKFAFVGKYPVFSILDPEVTFSLPKHQLACGIADTFVHVMEQYMTCPVSQSRLMDRWAEGILTSLIEIAPQIMADPTNYDLMSDFMLCSTMALNGFISLGVRQDWCTHMIGHEITALHGLTHGQSLAIVYPATMRVLLQKKRAKLNRFGEHVWGITVGTLDHRAQMAADKTEDFFRSLGLYTRLDEAGIGDDTIEEIARRFDERGAAFGEDADVTGEVARKILQACKNSIVKKA